MLKQYFPSIIRIFFKRIFLFGRNRYNQFCHINREGYGDFGRRFRYERKHPYKIFIGKETYTDDYNVWNASSGDIQVGSHCWFGLYNIVMGPIRIGSLVSTGPFVCFLGPRHAAGRERAEKSTNVGDRVWISTGSIINFGVQIGNGSIIGPGSVIVSDVPERSYFAGNPGRNLTRMVDPSWFEKR